MLATPAANARAIADKLRQLGFTVVRGTDLDRDAMEEALFTFGVKAEQADVA